MKSRRRKGVAKLAVVGVRVSSVCWFKLWMCWESPVNKDSVSDIRVSRSANAW